ncbi:amidohydrolase [Bacillota bacterium]
MKQLADLVLFGNNVFSGLNAKPIPGGIAIKGNRILEVFSDKDDWKAYAGDSTKLVNCGDKLIMPAFVDAHTHFFMGAAAASPHVCLDIENSTSPEECIEIVKEYERVHPEEKRIMAIGWYTANWNDIPLPDKTMLDEAFPNKPVYMLCADLHTAWINTKALEELGITEDTKPEYGEVRLDEDGKPNGILIEIDLMLPIFAKLVDYPLDILTELFRSFLKEVASYGITSLSEITAAKPNEEFIRTLDKLLQMEGNGDMSVRLHVYSNLGTTGDYAFEKQLLKKYYTDKIRYAGLKQVIDGVTSTYTGLLLEPYTDRPEMTCEANYPKEVFLKCTKAANREGLGIRYHCIGDEAVRWALDCFEEANIETGNTGNHRQLLNAIEHIENIHPSDIPRFKELGVIASMQPYHVTFDLNEKVSRIGEERCLYEWPFRSLIDSGAIIAFGTDYPVISIDPFRNIYAAVTRCDDEGNPAGINPQEAVTLLETLRAYTSGAARVYGRQNDLGTLEAGKLADVIVIDQNMFDIPAKNIPDCKVDLTIFDGEIIFERSAQ